MKQLLFIIAIAVFSANECKAQTDSSKYVFCEIMGQAKFMSRKLNVVIDYGTYRSIWKQKDWYLYDTTGNKMTFNSMVDALNYMSEQGWEFVNAYVVTVSNQNVYHYLLRKRITAKKEN